MEIGWQLVFFLILNFAQLIVLGGRLSSPNVRDIAGPENAGLIFNFPYIFINFFPANRVYPAKFTKKCIEIRTIN